MQKYNRPNKLEVGMVLIPMPQHFELLSKVLLKTECIITEEHIKAGATIGDMWMVKEKL